MRELVFASNATVLCVDSKEDVFVTVDNHSYFYVPQDDFDEFDER